MRNYSAYEFAITLQDFTREEDFHELKYYLKNILSKENRDKKIEKEKIEKYILQGLEHIKSDLFEHLDNCLCE